MSKLTEDFKGRYNRAIYEALQGHHKPTVTVQNLFELWMLAHSDFLGKAFTVELTEQIARLSPTRGIAFRLDFPSRITAPDRRELVESFVTKGSPDVQFLFWWCPDRRLTWRGFKETPSAQFLVLDMSKTSSAEGTFDLLRGNWIRHLNVFLHLKGLSTIRESEGRSLLLEEGGGVVSLAEGGLVGWISQNLISPLFDPEVIITLGSLFHGGKSSGMLGGSLPFTHLVSLYNTYRATFMAEARLYALWSQVEWDEGGDPNPIDYPPLLRRGAWAVDNPTVLITPSFLKGMEYLFTYNEFTLPREGKAA